MICAGPTCVHTTHNPTRSSRNQATIIVLFPQKIVLATTTPSPHATNHFHEKMTKHRRIISCSSQSFAISFVHDPRKTCVFNSSSSIRIAANE
jgi:hypothetical protein